MPTSSNDVVQATETRVGHTPVSESVGALGAVVSAGVVYVTLLLLAERVPVEVIATTE